MRKMQSCVIRPNLKYQTVWYENKATIYRSPWIQDVNLTYIRLSNDVQDVFSTSYVRSVYILCPGKGLTQADRNITTSFLECTLQHTIYEILKFFYPFWILIHPTLFKLKYCCSYFPLSLFKSFFRFVICLATLIV